MSIDSICGLCVGLASSKICSRIDEQFADDKLICWFPVDILQN